jgi:hypothetical protein
VGQTASVWLVLLAAIVAANLPFMGRRLFLVFKLAQPKSLAMRLGELVVYYFAVGGLGLLLENHGGQIAPQGWEFYAITGTLFITLAFPGFIARYLLKRRT